MREDVGEPAREGISAKTAVSQLHSLGVVPNAFTHARERQVRHKIIEPLAIEEAAASTELVVRDLAGQLEEAIATEAVRLEHLGGWWRHAPLIGWLAAPSP